MLGLVLFHDRSIRRLLGRLAASTALLAAVASAANYSRVCEPQIKPAFLPLPPGAVEPAGWLRDWAVAAREGITGHLDEYHPTFRDGWKGIPIAVPGAEPDGTGWPLEQCAYWLDGALRLGFVLHDEALIRKIRARLDPIVDGVNKADFGTSLIYWKKGYKPEGFNGWAHSQMGRALVALYLGSGDKRVLDALVKVYADYPAKMGKVPLVNCEVTRAVQPRRHAGDLLVQRRPADPRPRAGGHGPARRGPRHPRLGQRRTCRPATWSSSTRTSACRPWSIPGRATGGSCRPRWARCNGWTRTTCCPTAWPPARSSPSGVGAFRKTETCDVTAMLLTTSWMYRIQGNGDWGDRMERAFFNAGAAPIARDFKTMCYYQSPNRLRADSLPCEQPHSPGPAGTHFHQLGCPSVLCCVGAVNRIIPNYIIHMWMATGDDGLAATLYGPSTVSALAGPRVPVRVTTTTDYPFDETIRMKIEPERDVQFPLYLRIPGWCKQAEIRGQRRPAAGPARRQGLREDRPDVVRGRHGRDEVPDGAAGCPRLRNRVSRPQTAAISVSSRRPSSSPGGCPTRASSTVRCCSPCRFPTSIPTRR